MPLLFYLPLGAAVLSLVLGAASLFRSRRTVAAWCFVAGMAALALESLLTGLALRAIPLADVVQWAGLAYLTKCVTGGIWLAFTLTYSRGNYREVLARWTIPLALLVLAPVILALIFRNDLFSVVSVQSSGDVWRVQFGTPAKGLNVLLLAVLVLILTNLELTFRSSVGTMRWRIKFVVLGLALIFGARLYVRTQAILFSAPDIALWSLESGALVIGCMFLVTGYLRTRLGEVEVYPSLAVVRSSVTVLIVGGYLFVVGVLAQLVNNFGGAEIFRLQAVIVLVGMAGLALLVLSERLRKRLQVLVVRHFSKAQHDSVRIWTAFSVRFADVTDVRTLSRAAATLISETFGALSVTVWLAEHETGQLTLGASTAPAPESLNSMPSTALGAALADSDAPFDLDEHDEVWAEELRQLNAATFTSGGNRICVPLRTVDRFIGVIVLGDRVNAAVYTLEELELLKCIGIHLTSVLLSLRQGVDLAHAKELEAFRTMSAFFVHDLKNATASLNLMLKNLPVHFDDPAFRADALRGIGNTARRIDDMIARLSALRERTAAVRESADLNQLVREALYGVDGLSDCPITCELQPLPTISADREQIKSVVTNLVLNARDALGIGGAIRVRTEARDGLVVLSVTDNGCGMSERFVKESLFRPFQSTKKKGLGIGLFQCRAIVQAHGGGIQVTSGIGSGTTFFVSFPAGAAQ